MHPVNFPQANLLLTPPAGYPPEACGNLASFTDGKQIISCWELSDAELADLCKTRRVWLWVQGQGSPPVLLTVESPFAPAPEG